VSADPSLFRRPGPVSAAPGRQGDSLADLLERVLDRGIVIVGDIVLNVLDIELLTLKLRLFISSAETAREMGLDWWTRDPFFSGRAPAPDRQLARRPDSRPAEVRALHERITALEDLLHRAQLAPPPPARHPATDHRPSTGAQA
jgi:Gas vesicle protein